eukprot:gb/GFBE01002412.1/.p1 GENE.gb/GFBE01002412.1/~~gb/GFBE01002412.1/.p1  ORF type:complete len:109 (+),score=22.41 gb/GFBE01002412.1/:1-327(+)
MKCLQDLISDQRIFFLKVDTQGSDLAVVMSAGKMLRQIQHIQLEAVCDNATPTYIGAPNCSAVRLSLQEAGFSCRWFKSEIAYSCGDDTASVCSSCDAEIDLFFKRID